MKVVLFNWTSGGHHALYVRRFWEALRERAEVVLAVPDELAAELTDLDADVLPLGPSRPTEDPTKPLSPQHRALAEAELDLVWDAAHLARPDLLVHLCADPIIRRLVRRPSLDVPTSLLLFRPRAHFPSAYQASLGGPMETFRAWFLEYLVFRWRRRSDAHALLTLDEEAARRWARRAGAAAYWIPEPPVVAEVRSSEERLGFVLYGALAPRKGIDLLARAVGLAPGSFKITLAGTVENGFQATLDRSVAEMRRAGASVNVEARRLSEAEGLQALARARFALLPYPRHNGMSRVLLEACVVGTPVLVHDHGMLAHLVRLHHLGITVDCNDSKAFRRALLEAQETEVAAYAEALAEFALLYSREHFDQAVAAALLQVPAREASPATR